MKKYVTLDKDLSALVDQVNAYLITKNIDSPAYKIQLYHPIGAATDLVDDIPAIADAFAAEGLTIKGLGHYSLDNMIRPVPVLASMMIVPLANTENSVFHINEPKPEALPYTDYTINYPYYNNSDCVVVETFSPGSNPVMLAKDAFYSIENSDTDLAQFLVLLFNEDISSYFAE